MSFPYHLNSRPLNPYNALLGIFSLCTDSASPWTRYASHVSFARWSFGPGSCRFAASGQKPRGPNKRVEWLGGRPGDGCGVWHLGLRLVWGLCVRVWIPPLLHVAFACVRHNWTARNVNVSRARDALNGSHRGPVRSVRSSLGFSRCILFSDRPFAYWWCCWIPRFSSFWPVIVGCLLPTKSQRTGEDQCRL